MIKKDIKKFLVLFFVDFIFLFCVFKFGKFIWNKLNTYILTLRDLDIESLEQQILDNAQNLNLLEGNMEIISQVVEKAAMYSLLLLLFVFLMYCISQAINWNFCYNSKFKKFWKYLLSFTLINIPIFIIFSYLIYWMTYNLRGVVFNSWIDEPFLESQLIFGGSLPVFIILLIITLLFGFYVINVYVLMNKYKVKDSLIKAFKNLKNYKLLLRHLIYIVLFFVVFFTLGIHVILWLILFLILLEVYRIDFCRILN